MAKCFYLVTASLHYYIPTPDTYLLQLTIRLVGKPVRYQLSLESGNEVASISTDVLTMIAWLPKLLSLLFSARTVAV